MINFSRPWYNAHRTVLQHYKYTINFKRTSYAIKYKGIDKENYLNKRDAKDTPNYFAAFTLIFPLTCFGLAIWQIGRLRWKEKLLYDMKIRTTLPAIELPEDLSDRRKLEYRKIKVRGTFDYSQEMLIGPRSLIKDNKFYKSKSLPLPFSEPEPPTIGYIVITPFKLADRDLTILVNRGWIPADKKNPRSRIETQIEDEVELEGILRLKEDPPRYVLQNHGKNRLFKYRDIASMAELANTSFIYIDAIQTIGPGGPIGGQTQVFLKNDHLEYIITWSSLGLFLLYMWHKRFIRLKT